jgi:hypothetical protein
MLFLPRDMYSLSLAGVDLEVVTSAVEMLLRRAKVRRLPRMLHESVRTLVNDLWRMEDHPGRRRANRIERANTKAARCWAVLDDCVERAPSTQPHCQDARELLILILEELDRLAAEDSHGDRAQLSAGACR